MKDPNWISIKDGFPGWRLEHEDFIVLVRHSNGKLFPCEARLHFWDYEYNEPYFAKTFHGQNYHIDKWMRTVEYWYNPKGYKE